MNRHQPVRQTIQLKQGFVRWKHTGSHGQSIVETALVLPIMILIIMAIIDFGFLFNNYIVLSNASREAARMAAVGAMDAAISTRINSLTGTLIAANRTTSILPAQNLRTHGTQVTVIITYDNHMITPVIAAIFPGGATLLRSKTVMRVE